MQSKVLLNINFLEDLSVPSKILSERSLFITSLVGIACSSIIIPFLTLGLLGQGFYTEAAPQSIVFLEQAHLPANLDKTAAAAEAAAEAEPAKRASSQTPQNLVDSKPAKSIQNVAFSESASLPAGQAGSGLPIRLKIPKINVNAVLEQVGLTPDGSVDVPKGRGNAAWFKLGPRPGDNGSAIISGHYGYWKDGKKTVFNDLNKLEKGDKLYVKDKEGATTAFVVRESRRYDQNADAQNVFSSNDGQPHLILVTCEGAWNKVSKSYPQRLVIFADKE